MYESKRDVGVSVQTQLALLSCSVILVVVYVNIFISFCIESLLNAQWHITINILLAEQF